MLADKGKREYTRKREKEKTTKTKTEPKQLYFILVFIFLVKNLLLNLSSIAYYLGPVVKLCLFLLSYIKPLTSKWQTLDWQIHFDKILTGQSNLANP